MDEIFGLQVAFFGLQVAFFGVGLACLIYMAYDPGLERTGSDGSLSWTVPVFARAGISV